ncbi:relaxase/mobilization nuclease domain-containing protein [Paraeggerthella hongkongensis]|uniref:Relaxase n=1 Tax=Paraeggerthella hongkongensis TaxID=230658 RepID=A0A3N0BEB9_9ACTN|nr:relaxase/mobilization nuclease domain-containing protein [Paraeggerthella hongkongensis]RNL46020.1 relaxase [Paraeggerthella hongkongensis]
MPIIKPISGHTNTQRIASYLEKDGRALARDFFNLSWDEREMEGYDPDLKGDVRWADEMDRTREAFGNDQPHGGRPARTFKHYVISPDPKDDIGLEELQKLARVWVEQNFGDYQVAIIYHDDNEHGIPHAHVVVNNTNLATGLRLQDPFPRELNHDLQDIAMKQGLAFLSDDDPEADGFVRLAQKDAESAVPVRTRQDVFLSRAERRVLESGEYSWVNDIRSRVSMAKSLARNEAEFRQILDMLDVDVRDNSAKAKRADWIYSLRDQQTLRVGGELLGYTYGKEALQSRFARKNVARPGEDVSKDCMRIAMHATQINDLAELHSLACALETTSRFGITAMADFEVRIESAERKVAFQKTPAELQKLQQTIRQLEEARDFMGEKKLLPQQRSKPAKKKLNAAQKAAVAKRDKQAKTASSDSRGRSRRDIQQNRDQRHR